MQAAELSIAYHATLERVRIKIMSIQESESSRENHATLECVCIQH